MHTYRSNTDEVTVPQGYPHGDAWGKTLNPDSAPTHDVERYLELLAKKNKSKGKK